LQGGQCFNSEHYLQGTHRLANHSSLSPRCKKRLQNPRSLISQHARCDFHLVIQLRTRHNFEARPHRTALGVIGSVHQTWHPCLDHRSCAHAARFNGHVQHRASQPIISQCACRFPQHYHFRVRRRVHIPYSAVSRSRHNPSIAHQYGSDRHLTRLGCPARLFQRLQHELDVCLHSSREDNTLAPPNPALRGHPSLTIRNRRNKLQLMLKLPGPPAETDGMKNLAVLSLRGTLKSIENMDLEKQSPAALFAR